MKLKKKSMQKKLNLKIQIKFKQANKFKYKQIK